VINIVRSGRRRAGQLAAVGLLIGTLVTSASAEPLPRAADDRGRIYGYVFAAPLIRFVTYCEDFNPATIRCQESSWVREDPIPHVGAGVEWRPVRSVGLATEVGLVKPNGYPGGILSVNGTFYPREWPPSRRALLPFVTGGYSLDSDRSHGLNVGAGMTYAGRGAPGLRLEARSSFWEDYRALELRLGVIFGGS